MNTQDLKDFLKKAKQIVGTQSKIILPILENLKVENQTLTVTNLDIYYSKKFNSLPKKATFLIPLFFLEQIVRKFKGRQIDISVKGIIKTELGSFTYIPIEFSEFPEKLNKIIESEGFKKIAELNISTTEITKDALAYVGNDDLRPIMSGVNCGPEFITSTDAHILYFRKHNSIIEGEGFVLPAKIVAIKNIEKSIVYKSWNFIKIESKSETIIFREIEGRYPNWEAVIPKDFFTHITVCKSEFLNVLALASLSTNQTTKHVIIQIEKNNVFVSATDNDYGREYKYKLQEADIVGNPVQLGFKVSYLQLVISKSSKNIIKIDLSRPNKAIIINNEILVMPVQLN